jgi:hypothetical protein
MNRTYQRRAEYFRDIERIARCLTDLYGDHSHGNKVNPKLRYQ